MSKHADSCRTYASLTKHVLDYPMVGHRAQASDRSRQTTYSTLYGNLKQFRQGFLPLLRSVN